MKSLRLDRWHLVGWFAIFSSTILKIYLAIVIGPLGVAPHNVNAFVNGAIIAGFPMEQYPLSLQADASFLLPYVTSLLLRTGLGVKSLLYFTLSSNLLTTVLVYLLTTELYDKETAMLASCLVSLSWFFLFHSLQPFYEGPLVTLVTAVYFSLYVGLTKNRKLIPFSGTLCALMFLMKYPAVVIVANTFVILWLYRRRIRRSDILAFFISFLATILAWIYYQSTTIGIDATTNFGFYISYYTSGIVLDITRIGMFAYKYLYYIPYMTSAYSSIFGLLGILSIMRRWKREDYLVLSWFVSFFSFYCLYSSSRMYLQEYYSLNWLVPSLILSAKGMRDFLKDNDKVLRKFAVSIAVFSVYIEGPIPFLKLRTEFPFVFYKQTLFAHEKIIQKGTVFLESTNLTLFQALNSFNFEFTMYTADIVFFLSLLVPVFILIIRKAIEESDDRLSLAISTVNSETTS